jgi:hypothetical protein
MSAASLSSVLALLALQAPVDTVAGDAAAASATPVDVITGLAGRLATLRADVDTLAADVARERAALHDEVSALERRRRELEERIALATLTTRELEARAAAVQAVTAEASSSLTAAQSPVRDAIGQLRRLQARVPFRLHGRRERLAAVERDIVGLDAAQAAALVWPLLVDEARLLEERGRVRQGITVLGRPVMAEGAHVGPFVWWRPTDGQSGVASLLVEGDEPRFDVVDDAESRQRLTLFFESLRRPSPGGTWLVPSPLRPSPAAGATP